MKKQDVCLYKEQHTGSSQQNIANYFFLLCGKPISRRCPGNILSEKEHDDGCLLGCKTV
jgi:hypothetical protein